MDDTRFDPAGPAGPADSADPRAAHRRSGPRRGAAALMFATTWLAATWLAAPAAAQVCAGDPGPAPAAASRERFAMIAAQCSRLIAPLNLHRAAQLDLYDRASQQPATESLPSGAAPAEPPPAAGPVVTPVALPAAPARRPLAPPTRAETRVLTLAPALTEVAREYRIDPLLLHAIAHVESRHDPRAVSRAGARGVMQVMPATARRFGVATDTEAALLDPNTNLRASARYLQALRERFGDDLRLVLAAYNAGEGNVDKYGGVPPFPETQAYVRDVMAIHRGLSEAFTVSADGRLLARGGRS
ncbi:MAG: lytic transglycosylase domain-containing protein [Lautropia sp.]